MRTLAVLFLISAAAAGSLAAQSKSKDLCVPPPSAMAPSLPAKLLEGQGIVRFPITTGSPQAQAFFEQGVAQMHSFWAREAERSFMQAAELDPEAPMPQWGIAMAAAGDYRPRFQLEHYERLQGKTAQSPESRAVKAAKKAVELAAVPGKATDVEKLYVAAVAARRGITGSDPDAAYVQGLRDLVAKYPNEVEAKSYLALHLMRGFELPGKTPREGSMEAVNLLRELLAAAPGHAGVHHYVIHGWEGSPFASEAWPSCKRYAELVPNIPHALHMPGHIYAQTGKLKEAQISFSSAAENERGYMKADALYGSGHHGHNVHFLATAYSFAGEYDKAMEAARELLGYPENPREASQLDNFQTAYTQGWFAMLRTLVQAERWDAILDGTTLPAIAKPRLQAWRHWAYGLANASKGNAAAAKSDAARMSEAMKDYETKLKMKMPEELAAAREELEGHIQLASRKTKKGLQTLQSAARKELALRYTEPPYYPRPVFEALGSAALKYNKTSLAESSFRKALQQYPASFRATRGLEQARLKSGKPVEAGL